MKNASKINYSLKKLNVEFINQINELPVDPEIADEALMMIKNPRLNFLDLAKTIQRDHGLFLKILSAANSPQTGLPGRIITVQHAIIILGIEKIRELISYKESNNQHQHEKSDDWYRNIFWRHSAFVANTAKSIAEDLRFRKPENAFTAGLFHDIGILISKYYYPTEFQEIKSMVENDGFPNSKAEEITLGMNHTEIGKRVIEKLNLPKIIVEAIYNHHKPSEVEEQMEVASIVHLADFMVNELGISDVYWDNDLDLDKNIVQILRLNEDKHQDKFPIVYMDIIKEIMNNGNTNGENISQR